MMGKSNEDLLADLDARDLDPTQKAANASFVSEPLANIKDLDRPGSLLRETKGTGLGGQHKKPPPKIERK